MRDARTKRLDEEKVTVAAFLRVPVSLSAFILQPSSFQNGARGEIRTLRKLILSQPPLPIGLHAPIIANLRLPNADWSSVFDL
jgi:hypothetical protein